MYGDDVKSVNLLQSDQGVLVYQFRPVDAPESDAFNPVKGDGPVQYLKAGCALEAKIASI